MWVKKSAVGTSESCGWEKTSTPTNMWPSNWYVNLSGFSKCKLSLPLMHPAALTVHLQHKATSYTCWSKGWMSAHRATWSITIVLLWWRAFKSTCWLTDWTSTSQLASRAMYDDQVIPVCTITGRDPTLHPSSLCCLCIPMTHFIPTALILWARSLQSNIWMSQTKKMLLDTLPEYIKADNVKTHSLRIFVVFGA